jgi:DNA-binding GntR family transcriptional regulator
VSVRTHSSGAILGISSSLLSFACARRALILVRTRVSSAEAFGIAEGETVIHLRTLRRVNGVALCLIDHYFADLRFWPVLQTFTRRSTDSSFALVGWLPCSSRFWLKRAWALSG